MSIAPRLLICDDAPGFRMLIQAVFEQGGFAVAGTADCWEEAEAEAERLEPHAILLDLWLPTFDADAIQRVRAAAPTAVLAVVSALSAEEVAGLVDGIDGIDLVLSKREPPGSMVEALRGLVGAAGQGFEPR